MKQKLAFSGGLAAVIGAFWLLLRLPAEAAEGARQGLALCAGVIIPSLLPFLILSALAAALGLPAVLARLTAPVLSRLGIPPVCAAPLLLGFMGGYPVGAASLAELVRGGLLTPQEAARALPWCNNTGPGFIVGVAGGAVFGSVRTGLLLYLCHVLAALIIAILSGKKAVKPAALPPFRSRESLAAALPACMRAAATNTVCICAYVIFFSVLSALLRAAGVFSAPAAALSARFGTELRASYALFSGILELSSGVGSLRGMPLTSGSAALTAFLLGFGGLSVHCQTLYAVSEAEIKCARHFAGRILHGLLSALLAYGMIAVFMPPQI